MLGSRLILLLFRGYFLIKEEKLANLILCYKILENFLHSGYANFLITDWVVHLFLLPFCLVSSQLVMGTLILQENITVFSKSGNYSKWRYHLLVLANRWMDGGESGLC